MHVSSFFLLGVLCVLQISLRFAGHECSFVLFGFVSAFWRVASIHRVFFP